MSDQVECGIGVRASTDGRVWLDLFAQDASLGMTSDQAADLGRELIKASKAALEAANAEG